MSAIDERVRRVIAAQLQKPYEAVQASTRLADDLGADSLDTVEIVMAMELEFDIQLVAKEVRVVTVQDVVDYIKTALEPAEVAPPRPGNERATAGE